MWTLTWGNPQNQDSSAFYGASDGQDFSDEYNLQ